MKDREGGAMAEEAPTSRFLLSRKKKEEITLRLLGERGKRTSNEGEKELLSTADHIIICKGCGDERYTQTHLI